MKRACLILSAVLLTFFLWEFRDAPAFKPGGESRETSVFPGAESPAPDIPEAAEKGDGEVRAVWITQFELDAIRASSAEAFRERFSEMAVKCDALGLNTLFVQVRPNGDAFYPSSLYPWSVYASGKAGKDAGYDPLAIMTEEAHRRGLSLHAWINPFRLQPEKQIRTIPASFRTRQWYDEREESDRVVVTDRVCYLNPAYPEVRQLIFEGAAELLERYDVDGLQIDDYFYPTTDPSFDEKAYAALGEGESLSAFRTENVNRTVRGLCETVKRVRPGAVFSVSPGGNLRGNLEILFADVRKWASEEGYLDWIVPQIYWNYDHPAAPYAETLSAWGEAVTAPGVKLLAGLAPYRIADGTWENAGDVLCRMTEDARKEKRYGGVAFFNYSALFSSENDAVKAEREKLRTLFSS